MATTTHKSTTAAHKANVVNLDEILAPVESKGIAFTFEHAYGVGEKRRNRTNGCAVIAHVGSAEKSGVKGWTLAVIDAYNEVADEIAARMDAVDKAFKLGKYAPQKVAAPKSGLDPEKVAALSADEQTVLAALLAKLS